MLPQLYLPTPHSNHPCTEVDERARLPPLPKTRDEINLTGDWVNTQCGERFLFRNEGSSGHILILLIHPIFQIYMVRWTFFVWTWNYFNYDGPRTNNRIEDWQNRLQKMAPKAHPNLFNFIPEGAGSC